eukprot:RCo019620
MDEMFRGKGAPSSGAGKPALSPQLESLLHRQETELAVAEQSFREYFEQSPGSPLPPPDATTKSTAGSTAGNSNSSSTSSSTSSSSSSARVGGGGSRQRGGYIGASSRGSGSVG